ncbi:MAG: hypothetical protein O3B01_23760 [Planctomycetota bacterium]|nr:hypothetical protein [Planctomycetota bacterium]
MSKEQGGGWCWDGRRVRELMLGAGVSMGKRRASSIQHPAVAPKPSASPFGTLLITLYLPKRDPVP